MNDLSTLGFLILYQDGHDAWDYAVKYGRKKCSKVLREYIDEDTQPCHSSEDEGFISIFCKLVCMSSGRVSALSLQPLSWLSGWRRADLNPSSLWSVCTEIWKLLLLGYILCGQWKEVTRGHLPLSNHPPGGKIPIRIKWLLFRYFGGLAKRLVYGSYRVLFWFHHIGSQGLQNILVHLVDSGVWALC